MQDNDILEQKRAKNREYQRKYRQKQGVSISNNRRLNGYIEYNAFFRLQLLAKHHNLTQKEMLEKLINDAYDVEETKACWNRGQETGIALTLANLER